MHVHTVSDSGQGAAARPLATVPDPGDRLLGGLLSPDFDDRSCLSRYRAGRYRRPSTHALSSHLVSALRRYESLHRLCGPGTPAYARAVVRLHASMNGSDPSTDSECSYLVWTPTAGLGNQILSITSAFLYALLTDRALLLQSRGDDLDDLFCEPFPGSTWLLPRHNKDDDPAGGYPIGVPESLGSVLARGSAPGSPSSAPRMYVHLRHDYKAHDRLFFCDDVQAQLRGVPWLVTMADNYFAPGLFLVPRFEAELARMFPRRDAVFHHLGRYLFHPSNTVWGMVTRYNDAFFREAHDERVGVQVRMFKWAPISVDELYGQILSCVHRENILPGIISASRASNATAAEPAEAKRKAVVFASLYSEFSERLRDLYTAHGAAGGEAVGVFQPTSLGAQHFKDRAQNQKALAEMTLLSFADEAVTTAASTFGYVSQGLAGRRPWVLARPDHGKAPPGAACRLAPTIEPCFHAPPNYDCRAKARGDSGKTVRYLRHCEDFPQGVQLVE